MRRSRGYQMMLKDKISFLSFQSISSNVRTFKGSFLIHNK